jgi:hypothetical protein
MYDGRTVAGETGRLWIESVTHPLIETDELRKYVFPIVNSYPEHLFACFS